MSVLSKDVIENRTRLKNINAVTILNCWGCDIENIEILEGATLLEKFSASANKINSLKSLRNCHYLKELYVRKNSIAEIDDLKYIAHLKNLEILWLSQNPCTFIENYRLKVINILPQLSVLDNKSITKSERIEANLLKENLININPKNNDNVKVKKIQRTCSNFESKNVSTINRTVSPFELQSESKQKDKLSENNSVLPAIKLLMSHLSKQEVETLKLYIQNNF
ncbi:hypothetical protein A3Q56_00007 [Intoshia linei]|uniref:Uncharacterized protein n=1 Tax=Intoshia linei TaxID=1819745 RepID=A0A177BF40_9BILA|nr:hypothetical protein A3Q56_00007 [Intoshia linei]